MSKVSKPQSYGCGRCTGHLELIGTLEEKKTIRKTFKCLNCGVFITIREPKPESPSWRVS